MTQDQAKRATIELGRVIVMLAKADEYEASDIEAGIVLALDILREVPNPYADQSIRPGLNKPLEDSANV